MISKALEMCFKYFETLSKALETGFKCLERILRALEPLVSTLEMIFRALYFGESYLNTASQQTRGRRIWSIFIRRRCERISS